MGVEREVKLNAVREVSLPDLSGVLPGVRVGTVRRRDLNAVYYDTADLALARSGVTLRYRTGEDVPLWTLKFPLHDSGSMLVRRELDFSGEPDTVPADARDLVRAFLRSRRLRRVARLLTERTEVPLVDSDGQLLAELVDDVVSVQRGRANAGHFREVEVEFLEGTPRVGRLRKATVARLVSAGCTEGSQIPKLVRALGDEASAPPDVTPVDLRAKASLGELVEAALSASVIRLISHDAGVRLGDDPEDVHQFRVAARRLRSDLKTFRDVLDPEWVQVLRTELHWLGTEVGALRDADVLRERLLGQAADFGDQDASGVAALAARLDDQRAAARARALDALRRHRYDTLLDALVDATKGAPFAESAKVRKRADRHALGLVRRQWEHLDAAVDKLGAEPSDEQFHRVRILAKQARYAVDVAAAVFGEPAHALAERIADIQTDLGDLHDTAVAMVWLREAAGRAPRSALVAGQLIAMQRAEAEQIRERWPRTWRATQAKGLLDWLEG
jgi:CHAD domain-containing protein